jgi:hypothetical protein
VAEDGGRAVELVRERRGLGEALGRDERAVLDPLGEEGGGREGLPVCEAALRERAQDVAVRVEDVAVRVAEGALLDPGRGVRYESSFFRMPRKPRNRRQ